MDKNKTKVYDAMRAQAVKSTANWFKVSETYVRRCIGSGDIGGRSEEIKRYFNKMYNDLQKIISA